MINLMFDVAPDVADQPEELSPIVDYNVSNFPCFPFEDLMGCGRGAGTRFIQGIRTFAGAI
jgi:hypothetical protein